jgi:hypothetical protein
VRKRAAYFRPAHRRRPAQRRAGASSKTARQRCFRRIGPGRGTRQHFELYDDVWPGTTTTRWDACSVIHWSAIVHAIPSTGRHDMSWQPVCCLGVRPHVAIYVVVVLPDACVEPGLQHLHIKPCVDQQTGVTVPEVVGAP